MKILIIHPEAKYQPVATTMAEEIKKVLPPDAELMDMESIPENQATGEDAELVLAVFSLKPGAFAPLVPAFQALRNKKVAFVALITGPVDFGRLRKCSWGIKKQFCGNELVGGYFCPTGDDMVWGPSEIEVEKAQAFARKFYEENAASEIPALAVNY